jgi:hypothetical protein
MTKTSKRLSSWGVELELFNGRCVYLSAKLIEADSECVTLTVADGNIITVPKSNIRRMLVMCSYER